VVLHARDWSPADLEGAAFAIAAFEDEGECLDAGPHGLAEDRDRALGRDADDEGRAVDDGAEPWVAAARDWRAEVSARYHVFGERRAFWERFTDLARGASG
jgi:uroporphyrin-III C-methyltransferase/precorrin-2 dehydrogenase/sirohydrochlorin ferrochelatase